MDHAGGGPEGVRPASKPRISVIIAITHREVLAKAVAALALQTLPGSEFEVIIADGLLCDDWRARLPEVIRATGRSLDYSFHVAPTPSRAVANNIGIAHARADVLLFDADDFALAPGSLEAHLRFHEAHPDPRAVGIGGGFFEPALRADPYSQWLEDSGGLFGVSFTSGGGTVPPGFFYAGNASVKRALIDQAGAFDEDFPHDAWDDYELSLRLSKQGMRATYLPDAPAAHVHAYFLAERRQTMRWAGQAATILERKYPGVHPWQREGRTPPWRHRAAALRARAAYLLTGRPEHQERYYRRTIAADFALGYRSAASASPGADGEGGRHR